MSFLEESFEELGIEQYDAELSYSGKFRGYNGNIRHRKHHYDIRLAQAWEDIDEEIQKGCIQSILSRVHKIKSKTPAMQLYDSFLKALGEYAPRTGSDPYLVQRFEEINDEYFDGLMTQPNLEWGQESFTLLGRYEYSTDTVRISTALQDNEDMLDYVLYHELLHKKHKFTSTGTQTRHHTKAFREDEARFRIPDAEQQLKAYIRQKKRPKRRSWF